MNANTISIQAETKNKKKARKISAAFHLALLALAIFPFLTPSPESPKPTDKAQFVTVDFRENFESSMGKASKPKASEKAERQEKTVEEKAPEAEKVEAAPTPEPTPAKDPVLKTEAPTPPIVTAPKKQPERERKPPVFKPTPKPPVKPTPKTKPTPKPPKKPTPKPPVKKSTPTPKPGDTGKKAPKANDGKTNGKKTNSDKSKNGPPSDTGSVGKEDNTNDNGKGTAEEDDGFGDFPGDGLFNRKVVYRADVKKLTEFEGRLVVNLCINQSGTVTFAEFNTEESTIKDKSLSKKAVDTVKRYRFAKDYSAPNKQCGKLSIVFDGLEE